jgi:3-oxoacyl-[acyl-carrier-protein] synthase II
MHTGMHSVHQALEDANIEYSSNVGVFYSTCCSKDGLYEMMAVTERMHPLKALNLPVDSTAGVISQHYGFTGINFAAQSACATGLVTIDMAMRFLDEYDYVVVGGSDNGVNEVDLEVFTSLRALGNKSMPFDNSREGFVMGEGAGCMILEREDNAIARGANIYGYLYPVAHASDAFDRTNPSGVGGVSVMNKAMANAEVFDVDYVNAHGTSTMIGDKVEYEAISKVGDYLVTSNKGKIGHTFAAAGILETIYSLLSIQHNIIPHTQNCVDTEFERVVKNPIKTNIDFVLNNSFGFGGKCASLVISSS